MGLLKATAFGLVGGAIGAAIWAAIVYFANYELGIIAWLVGVLVGLGVRLGAGEQDGWTPGLLAGGLAIAAVVAGKYAVVAVIVHQITTGVSAQVSGVHENPQENAIAYLADQVARERERAGTPVDWPAGVDEGEAYLEPDYPADIWQEAERRWNATHTAYRDLALTTPLLASDEHRTAIMGHLIASETQGGHAAFAWPPRTEHRETALLHDEFPDGLWTAATDRLAAMDDAAHHQFAPWAQHWITSNLEHDLEQFSQGLTQYGFSASFTPWDALWLFFAVGSAFKLGSGLVESE